MSLETKQFTYINGKKIPAFHINNLASQVFEQVPQATRIKLIINHNGIHPYTYISKLQMWYMHVTRMKIYVQQDVISDEECNFAVSVKRYKQILPHIKHIIINNEMKDYGYGNVYIKDVVTDKSSETKSHATKMLQTLKQ